MADEKKFWTTKSYILAALGATLAATAMVTIVSIILSPAHISFSVARAWRQPAENGATYLKLTITAANGSRRRVEVRYQSVFVDLKNSTSAVGASTIHTQVDPPDKDRYLLPGEPPVNINASVLLVSGDWDEAGGFRGARRRVDLGGFTVAVTAQVRFKVGPARTRLYDIKVSCRKVLFPQEGSARDAAQQPVNCTA